MQLGPLLGIEQEYRYTVCFLSEKELDKKRLFLQLGNPEAAWELNVQPEMATPLIKNHFYRFSFTIPERELAYEVQYKILYDGDFLSDRHSRNQWHFEVPDKDQIPKIGFCSCNGNSDWKMHPRAESDKGSKYAMWKKMWENHQGKETKFHCLLMGGDQIYADSLWSEVPYFNGTEVYSIDPDEKLFIRTKIADIQADTLRQQLADYYEELYIESWSDEYMSWMMASVPTVMMWDDHDIFDGWGSLEEDLQHCEIFQEIFKVAQRYFELFQIRGKRNASLIRRKDDGHYSMHFSMRNTEVIVLDNRSHRTRDRVMPDHQYADIENVLNPAKGLLFRNVSAALQKEKVLCFLVPIPIAHLNYSKTMEGIMDWRPGKKFYNNLNDDVIDHWGHKNHEKEQIKLLDIIFAAGEAHQVKNVVIVSGDVHTAGAAKITSKRNKRTATQLISSGIVHHPPTWFQRLFIFFFSRKKSKIDGYELELTDFGPLGKKVIAKRNFGFFGQTKKSKLKSDKVLQAYIFPEDWKGPNPPRRINTF